MDLTSGSMLPVLIGFLDYKLYSLTHDQIISPQMSVEDAWGLLFNCFGSEESECTTR